MLMLVSSFQFQCAMTHDSHSQEEAKMRNMQTCGSEECPMPPPRGFLARDVRQWLSGSRVKYIPRCEREREREIMHNAFYFIWRFH